MQKFMRALLKDVQALEYMLDHNWFEEEVLRIGAEQEIILVDQTTMTPSPVGPDILSEIPQTPWLKPELAKFNLETNLLPRDFSRDCLSLMEDEGLGYLEQIRTIAHTHNAEVALTGILPSLHKHDVEMHNLTPKDRYKKLQDITKEALNGEGFYCYIQGIDELRLRHHSTLLPACGTSFQVHLQVPARSFVQYYNIAQLLAGPILAISANSPLLFGKRLWHESRMALFQQSTDTRLPTEFLRQKSPRAYFGDDWLHSSVLEIYREDICRHRVLLGAATREDAVEMIRAGKTPLLEALQIHNSTIYRWNRPCYGISSNGQPHLRIENRLMPSGPTLVDEMANAAFWFGLMIGIAHEYPDVKQQISFADTKDNFVKAARYGLKSELAWLNGQSMQAQALILQELLPIAEAGLKSRYIDAKDVERYLGIIEQRASAKRTGASWMAESYSALLETTNQPNALTALTASLLTQQWQHQPVHTWVTPKTSQFEDQNSLDVKVEGAMCTKPTTVQADDIVDLAQAIMAWEQTDYVLVEDNQGYLVGVIYKCQIEKYDLNKHYFEEDEKRETIGDMMTPIPAIVDPSSTQLEAIQLMQQHNVSYLPVVSQGLLVGVVTKLECPPQAWNGVVANVKPDSEIDVVPRPFL